ncbi:MAG: trypsin-like peptidase domain-containing protein [Pseudomonadales bacterium]|nr:trypsin-like peptidase domain-containing protein [Pseudomonadales bacterium]
MQVTRGRDVARQTSGFVVQADRFNGYIVTNAEAVAGADSLTVTVPGTGGRLVAQVVRSDLSNDYALLKVNGLDLPALEFARQEPSSGEVVWTAAKVSGSEKVSLSKGLLRTGFKLAHDQTGWYQHTASNPSTGGSVLLNECGHVLGLNFLNPAGDGSIRAVDMSTMYELLAQQNIKPTVTSSECVSEVVEAREKAEAASEEARQAQSEAIRAQEVARELEKELNASKRSNDGLLRQTEIARQRADEAIAAAERAKARADNTQRELEEKTLVLREETQALLKAFEEERVQAEARFQDLLQSQQESAESRERTLLGFSGALIIVIGFVLFLGRVRNSGGAPPGP